MPAKNLSEDEPIEVLSVRQMRILYSWKAPLRPFKKRNREFWTTVLAIILLVGVILMLMKEWLPILAMVSLFFVYYAFSTVSPEEIEYRITTRGISFQETSYDWDFLWRFWFSEKYGKRILNLQTRMDLPDRLSFVVGGGDEAEIEKILEKYLLHEEAPPSFLEKISSWFSRTFPLEIEEKETS